MDRLEPRIVTVDGNTVEQEGFFCYKSAPKSQGYKNKLAWLKQRCAEGLRIKILYEGARSVGFIEYMPGEYAWRAVDAPGYSVIHCLWVVGSGKGKGYGTVLLNECIADARRQGRHGVVMVSSSGNWLAKDRIFLKNGFEPAGAAPPFRLLVKQLAAGPQPSLPQDWDKRLQRFATGASILYADQCPYIPNAVRQAADAFAARGVQTKVVKLESSAEARTLSPTPYGVFAIIYRGELVSYSYLGDKEMARLDDAVRRNP